MADELNPNGEGEHDLENPHTPPDPESGSALDRALLEATGGEVPEGVQIDPALEEAAKTEAAEKAKQEEARKAQEAAKAEEAKKAEEAAKLAATDPDSEAAKKAAADAAAAAAKKEGFQDIQLPPYAKPATTTAFARVKELAAKEIADAQAKLQEQTARLTELEAKQKEAGKLPAEVEKELAELRDFRAKLDVEADPKFKETDAKISENVESIYAKLKAVGTTDEVIKKIKEMGGPAELDWEAMADKLPSSAKRYIEGKLFENEDLTERRNKALAEAKANAKEYVKTRAEATQTEVQNRLKAVQAKVAELSPNAPWVNDRTATKPEEKAEVEAHNKRAAEIRATMKEAVETDTPEMKAMLVLGIAQLQRVQGDFEAFKATANAEKAALETKLKEATDLLEKIKKSGKPRLGAAPSPGEIPRSDKVNVLEDAGSALDRLHKEALAQKGD